MSITRTVERRALVATGVVVVVVACATFGLAAGSPGPAGAAPGPAPTAATSSARAVTDPAARVATLSALVTRRTEALAAVTARRDDTQARLAEAEQAADAARARTDHLSQVASEAASRYTRSRARLVRFAAAAYRDGSSVTPLTQLLGSDSAGDLTYRSEIVRRIGTQQHDLVDEAKRDQARATATAEAARRDRDRLVSLAASLERDLPARQAAVTSATASRDDAEFWMARWESIIAGPATPILGPARLSAEELTAWFNGTHHHAHITVPIDEIATDYLEEGAAVGVRSDIAFAQSMLETGGFSFPAGGQVLPTDNNFAGMGACDSCATGNRFSDARTGVRAQLQQLRVYADPHLTNAELNPPPVNPKLDQHYLKGTVTTWAGLTHTWATADTYGDRILGIYEQMLAWLTDRAKI
jgi:hypothetical protein